MNELMSGRGTPTAQFEERALGWSTLFSPTYSPLRILKKKFEKNFTAFPGMTPVVLTGRTHPSIPYMELQPPHLQHSSDLKHNMANMFLKNNFLIRKYISLGENTE
jgi:hypothetical protein